MVNISYTDSGDIIAYADGEPVIYNNGDIAWVLASTALVLIMTPGVGFFYSGLLRRKNALSMLMMSLAVFSVVVFQWFFWGYSLTFAPNGSRFIGTLSNFGLMDVLDQPFGAWPKIPVLLYCVYQMMFAAITPMIAVGGMAERGRLGPVLLFVFIWTTIVYDPVACWTWAPNGWLFYIGSLDFAGGGPVHMTSGTAAFAYAIWLGRRRGYGTDKLVYRPHNVSHVVLGTALLWFGWLGFNGGSALAANLRAMQACIVTLVAPASGGITWMLLDWRLERKWSAVGLCSGIVSGLVGITPASGYVGTPAALCIGVVTAAVCNQATRMKNWFKVDECLDVAATHMVGGAVGNILTAFFADSRVTGFDGISVIPGGWINHHYIQLGWQLSAVTSIIGYSFVVTMIILVVLDFIPGCSLRASEEAEIIGIDAAEVGEFAYDYAAIERHVEEGLVNDGSSSRSGKTDFHEKEAPQDLRHPAPPTAEAAAVPA